MTAVRERLSLNKEAYCYVPVNKETLRRQQGEYYRAVMEAERDKSLPAPIKFSIITPLYMTDKTHLEEMIESVKAQSWGGWELILEDASPSDKSLEHAVSRVARDGRIIYYSLAKNGGISANTNAALKHADGDYIVLLDHDDILTPDALYETAKAIESGGLRENPYAVKGRPAYKCVLAYSDEDKFSDNQRDGRTFFEPHIKTDFDLDKLLTNNYICHLTAIRYDMATELMFRSEFDGAQDHDIMLRCCAGIVFNRYGEYRRQEEALQYIVHVPRVLYHWRSHEGSTSSNPSSKSYAYNAGKRCIEDFVEKYLCINNLSGDIQVKELPHLGFFRLEYKPDIFSFRKDVGVIGGRLTDRENTISGGLMNDRGEVIFKNLPSGFSGGFQHPAALQQSAEAVDIRKLAVRAELRGKYEEIIKIPYKKVFDYDYFVDMYFPDTEIKSSFSDKSENLSAQVRKTVEEAENPAKEEFPSEDKKSADIGFEDEDADTSAKDGCLDEENGEDKIGDKKAKPEDKEEKIEEKIRELSVSFCKEVRRLGYRIVWDPQFDNEKSGDK